MPTFRREEFLPQVHPELQKLRRSLFTRHKSNSHVAFIFGQRKALLAVAMNKVGSRSSGAGYSDCMIHAERAAIKQLGDMSKLKGATMVVVRVGVRGDLMISKPCRECQPCLEKCMRKHGLRCVYYS
jgi:hypothetical protein